MIEDELKKIMNSLINEKEAVGAMIINREGIPLITKLPSNLEEIDLATSSAVLGGASKTIIRLVTPFEKPKLIIIEDGSRKIFYKFINESIMLLLITNNKAVNEKITKLLDDKASIINELLK